MGDVQILSLFSRSFTLVVMLVLSVVSVAVALERWWYFRGAQSTAEEILGAVRKFLEGGKTEQAASWCQKHPSAVAQVVGYGLIHVGRSRRDLEELMTTKLKEERLKLERYL